MKRDIVTMTFRGRTRSFPVVSFAIAFRRDPEETKRALDILVFGPPEYRVPAGTKPAQPTVTIPSETPPGEPVPSNNQRSTAIPRPPDEPHPTKSPTDSPRGGRGGTFPNNVSETIRNVPNEGSKARVRETNDNVDVTLLSEGKRAEALAFALGDMRNAKAIRSLVRAHPPALLDESFKRTMAVPDDRVRGTRGALFTGIVRRLTASNWKPPHS